MLDKEWLISIWNITKQDWHWEVCKTKHGNRAWMAQREPFSYFQKILYLRTERKTKFSYLSYAVKTKKQFKLHLLLFFFSFPFFSPFFFFFLLLLFFLLFYSYSFSSFFFLGLRKANFWAKKPSDIVTVVTLFLPPWMFAW